MFEESTLTQVEEQAAVTRVLQGDPQAFQIIIEQYQGLAYSLAYRALQDNAAASDAVQDSFVKAYRALHQFQGGNLKSWLMRIVINTCYDVLRSSQYRRVEGFDDLPVDEDHTAVLIDDGPSPHEMVERAELSDWIEAAIKALPADQRMIVVLADVHGYAYEEIAGMLNLPMGTVKSRLSRARMRLRDYLLKRPELLPATFRPRHD
jgi:RNA polymerase sigma-70 factor (ECF subfamily)